MFMIEQNDPKEEVTTFNLSLSKEIISKRNLILQKLEECEKKLTSKEQKLSRIEELRDACYGQLVGLTNIPLNNRNIEETQEIQRIKLLLVDLDKNYAIYKTEEEKIVNEIITLKGELEKKEKMYNLAETVIYIYEKQETEKEIEEENKKQKKMVILSINYNTYDSINFNILGKRKEINILFKYNF